LATKHSMPRLFTIGAALMFVASACGTSSSPGASGGAGGASADLIAKAKAEGALNVIALPDDWCNYKDMKAGFTKKYGIKINDNNPDAGSGDEIEAIKSTKGQTGDSTPDVVDVGIAFGDASKKDNLFQAYKVSTWDSIDSKLKDPDGFWYGDYFSILTFEVNKTAVANTPKSWADLLKP
jgi:putative spermidine/putrescine transport system substrate-binding protein